MFCLISYKRVVRDQDLSFRITHKVYWKRGVQVTIVFLESCLGRNCWLEWEVFCFPPTISPTPLTVLQNKTFMKTIQIRRLFATLLSATAHPPPAPLSRWCWAVHFVHPSAYFVWSEETKWAADVETNVWNGECRGPAGPRQVCNAGADAKWWGAASSSTGFCRKNKISIAIIIIMSVLGLLSTFL